MNFSIYHLYICDSLVTLLILKKIDQNLISFRNLTFFVDIL